MTTKTTKTTTTRRSESLTAEQAPTREDVYDACARFLSDWDRQAWMECHGEWASAAWDDEREAYDDASARVQDALADGESVDVDDLLAAMDDLREAAEALRDQVLPDHSDYIAEGTIDPSDVRSSSECLDVGESAQGWDCTEGWSAYRSGDALVIQWYRHACGQRHDRDLGIVVDEEFFA